MSKFNVFMNQVKNKLPDILVWTGVAGVLTGTVMACVATKKTDPVFEEHKQKMEQINMAESVGKDIINGSMEEYTPEVARKETFKEYVLVGGKLVKIYAPSALVIGGSLCCILQSNRILNTRNAALTAAYTTLDTCYKNYRKQVVEKYGEDTDKELAFGLKPNKSKDNTKTYKETEKTNREGGYYKCFDETNILWDKSPNYNITLLTNQENWANDRLRAMGTVSLNEVYESLGFERTQEGQVIGWIYDPEIEHKISFGITDISNPIKKEFMNGTEKAIWLDFNVDGVILNAIPLKR